MNAFTHERDWRTPTATDWKRTGTRAIGDACYILLRVSGWMAMTLLATFGVAILFFLMLLSYIQNLITGNNLRNTEDLLTATKAQVEEALEEYRKAQANAALAQGQYEQAQKDLQGLTDDLNQKQDELRRLYNAADVFVMPSRREPFGLVALEAMACGLPVVGSNEGGLPEFINSQVGTLVSPEDEEAFCAAILNELTRHHTEPERRDIIAHYASSNFAQAQFVAKLEQVYQRAVRDFSG